MNDYYLCKISNFLLYLFFCYKYTKLFLGIKNFQIYKLHI